MVTTLVRRILWTVIASLVSCGTRKQSVNGCQIRIRDLRAFTESIATAAYWPVAIIHGNGAGDGSAGKDWHVGDVVEFRKDPSGRFSLHIT